LKKVGRKSYWTERIEPRLVEIMGWARDGLLDKQMAELLNVSETTFLKYKAEKPVLADALKVNKQIADLQVENALRDRALGFEYEEVIEEYYFNENGNKVLKSSKVVKKKVLPDTTAQIFWLKNRQPEKWRDKIGRAHV